MRDGGGATRDGLAPRSAALAVLERVERDGAFADIALAATLDRRGLAQRDRALAARLVYGTLAWQALLDWHLATLAGREPQRLARPVRLALRLGLFQLLRLDRI